MDRIVTNSTSTTQWKSLVTEASQAQNITLHEDLESYLVFLLMRFTESPNIAQKIIGMEYLETMHQFGTQRNVALRDIGDQCLLYSGLFPERARRKRVRVSYFINIGKSAYITLAQPGKNDCIFNSLAKEFVPLMDIMHSMREIHSNIPILDPIMAEEVWRDTGSNHALETLRKFTVSSIPININSCNDSHKKH